MKILVVNPNSSEEITRTINAEAQRICSEELTIDVITSEKGPSVIESATDEVVAAYQVIKKLEEKEGTYDAAVIACASDPGLLAAKEIFPVPIIGIFEAAIHICNLQGNQFLIIASGGSQDISAFRETARRYGLESRLASVRYLDIGVAGVKDSSMRKINELIQTAITEDGVNGVILGCAAFAGMGSTLSIKHGIHVSDGIADAVYMAQMMVHLQQYAKGETKHEREE